MKLVGIVLENFRGYRERTYLTLKDFTVIVGRNDVGKSTLLEALDIFFENSDPDQYDGCIYGDKSKVRIGGIFSDFPESVVIDASNPTSLSSEFLLNSEGLLEIHKIYDCTMAKPKCKSIIALANHPTVPSCLNLLSLTNAKLKAHAKDLEVPLTNVDMTKNSEIREAIRNFIGDLNLRDSEVSLDKESGARAWESLKNYLPVFALFKSDRPSSDQDIEAQDPMRSAIKDAIREQLPQLEALKLEVQSKVQEIASLTIEKLREFSPALASQLRPNISTKNWDTLFNVSLTDENEVSMNKRGSGVRRLILLNFFRAKAELVGENNNSSVIYAIEEPETSQHPYNQKLLVEALQELVENQSCQVILTTHTPVLARTIDQNNIRYVKNVDAHPRIVEPEDENLPEIIRDLGVLPDHSVKCFFGVEGKHDIAFLKAISKVLNQHDSNIPDLSMEESSGRLVFIPLGGSNLNLWLSRLNGLSRPIFYLMDRDTTPPAVPKYQAEFDAFVREGHTAWITNKKELENYLHHSLLRSLHSIYEGDGSSTENVPHLLAKAKYESNPAVEGRWDDLILDRDKLKKKEGKAKHIINHELVNQMTIELLNEVDPDGEIRGWLLQIDAALNRDV